MMEHKSELNNGHRQKDREADTETALHPRSLTALTPPSTPPPRLIIHVHGRKKKESTKQRIRNNRETECGKNKAITPQLSAANCSFNDEVLDDERDEDSDDGENHEEEEGALLVRQASSGSVGLRRRPGARAGRAAAARRRFAPLGGEGHRGAVGTAQLRGVLALPDSAHPETVVAVGLQVVDVEGCGGAFVGLRGRKGRKGGKNEKCDLKLYPPSQADGSPAGSCCQN